MSSLWDVCAKNLSATLICAVVCFRHDGGDGEVWAGV